MQIPVKIAYRGLRASEAVSDLVHKKAAKLERYFDRITGCSVALEVPSTHHRHGKHYRVRIELSVPGQKLVVGRDPAETKSHEDLYAAINAAFREAKRQLQDHARRSDHRVRAQAHVEPARARVARVFPEEGYGFLETADGREIYFNEKSVLQGGFRRLRVGSEVRFAEEMGEEGPQASTVAVASRQRRSA
jgi:ribosomal subunit interface protein